MTPARQPVYIVFHLCALFFFIRYETVTKIFGKTRTKFDTTSRRNLQKNNDFPTACGNSKQATSNMQ